MEEILVTGATGTVGHHVVQLLRDHGLPVRATTTHPTRGQPVQDPELSTVRLDFTDAATWDAAFTGVKRMFLMRPPHLSRPKRQMLPALARARELGVEHMVFLSLQGAERNRVVPHAAIESWLRDSGLTWTFVRASFFMQNLTTTHRSDITQRSCLMIPAGSGRTAFVDAHDVAAVAVEALIDPASYAQRACTPTGPEALTYGEVAAVLSEALQRPVTYGRPGLLRYAAHARRELAMPLGMVAVTSAIYSAARFGLADGLTDDVLQVTGRSPTSLRDFVAREVANGTLR